jgi:hypothetical protein
MDLLLKRKSPGNRPGDIVIIVIISSLGFAILCWAMQSASDYFWMYILNAISSLKSGKGIVNVPAV